jgi:serine protease
MYLIYWGDSWSDTSANGGDPDGVQAIATSFAKVMGGTRWLNTVTQYFDPQLDYVSNTPFNVTVVNVSGTPPAVPQFNDLAAVAAHVAQQYGDYNINANFVVLTPHGVLPEGFPATYCAWHSSTAAAGGTIAFTNLPYIPDAGYGCGESFVHPGAAGIADGVSVVLGHEQAEAETDPQLTAWYDINGDEIADKCAWQNVAANPNAAAYPTQPLWSNRSASCVQFF